VALGAATGQVNIPMLAAWGGRMGRGGCAVHAQQRGRLLAALVYVCVCRNWTMVKYGRWGVAQFSDVAAGRLEH